jgi:cell division septation protein DedD
MGGPAVGTGSGSVLGADAVAAMAAMGPRAFGIQLGAFASEAGASNQWHVLTGQFPGELRGLTERIVAAETGSGRIYRLQATVGEEDKARAICAALRKRSQDCVPVLPRLPH